MYENFIHATLVRRINRFVAEVLINNTVTDVYVPNTGRLSELALPGAKCLLTDSPGKYRYKILYIISKNFPVMIDSTLSNSLFAELLEMKKVPGYEKFTLSGREPVYGRHRFDYILSSQKGDFYAELKSCTLFYKSVASFPDAISLRASTHITELASTGNGRLIIFILNNSAEVFVPNFHTDFNFYLTMKKFFNSIKIDAFRISYNDKLEIDSLTPVPVLVPEVTPSGNFFIVLASAEEKMFYIFSSAYTDNVFENVKKFRKSNKSSCYLNIRPGPVKILADIPVIAGQGLSSGTFELFNASGGEEKSYSWLNRDERLYCFDYNPLEKEWFHDHIMKLRFGALENSYSL